ncbi:type VI secretion system contractile sheath large subunit [Glacieibacterium megasporae]|uniref:type VI secretion system contractile sheath large subunit n=1 Tax=Glacieibacterium megasporae TaxID=2835787 RepID=UPI001C1DE08D|nr:type VI secretion system contractile sheath large subunit [Polymorphobacter megasporae]UAJ11310.1 type VI secretion system contractile sheath large subunit [Polymorphobacter megasporae]
MLAASQADPVAAEPFDLDFVTRLGRGAIASEAIADFVAATPGDAIALWFGEDAPVSARLLQLRLDRAIAAIDAALSAAVVALIGHPRFRALESAWRGVAWLTQSLMPDNMTQLRLLDVRWHELARDLERAPEFDRSALFLKVYEDEFGTPGGTPYSLLISLHEVRHRPAAGHPVDDIATLRHLSTVAAAAFAPIILNAAPALFAADTHADLDLRRSVSALFRQLEYGRLQALQRHPDTRFLGLVAPRIIVRAPWERASLPDLAFRYTGNDRALTAGGSLAVAHVAMRAFNDHRWPASITGTVRDEFGGGLITGLPEMSFDTDRRGVAIQPPIEVNVSDTIDRELNDAGIIAIRCVRDTPWLAVYSLPSMHRSEAVYHLEAARANDRLSSMLSYMLCVARFAHYIKVIGRDMIGSMQSASEVEARLQRWLNTYTTTGDRLSAEMQARYPLEEARIRVVDAPERPGALECSVWLRPHFQIDQAVSEFHLVTVVAQPG